MAVVTLLVTAGLVVVAHQLTRVRTEMTALRDQSLPRLVKLSQLSQDASASIAVAPALSANPTRYEFETLLSRIKDKTNSQDSLIAEISALITDADATRKLKNNATALSENQANLTTVVRRQIDVRKRLEKHIEAQRRMARGLPQDLEPGAAGEPARYTLQTEATIQRLLATLLDTNRARFSRNKKSLAASIAALEEVTTSAGTTPAPRDTPADAFLQYWSEQSENIFRDKSTELTNAFMIKALVEENSLIANRLLSTASTEFARASATLSGETSRLSSATRDILFVMAAVVAAFVCGGIVLWLLLRFRVLRRLDQIRAALRVYAQDRRRSLTDTRGDEIGEISAAFAGYMDEIDRREAELSEQTKSLQRLSSQLSRYLSPQIYESIFSGKQEVKVASTRKKLTVFFSDIVDFTETADRMESEELTALLNNYLTEMSRIALEHGATIDKYVGDAILVFFGDPETRGVAEDALACVKMAIAMRDRLKALDQMWRNAGIERPLNCRFGIHTGYCTVGNFGSETRMDYTIIGGAVNTAARLQAVADPGHILVSYETCAHVKAEVACQAMGDIEIRGIAYPIEVYDVIGAVAALDSEAERICRDSPGLRLEVDPSAMDVEERKDAAEALQRALALVNGGTADRAPG